MKKIVFILLVIAVLVSVLSVSCKKKYDGFKIGDTGPAGGIVFYDKGEYSGGWRYLEAAPADLRVVGGAPTVDRKAVGYDKADLGFIFGLYRKSGNENSFLYVNGKTSYSEKDCTGTAVGTGKKNTELLVKAMGKSAYTDSIRADTTSVYAAKLCSDLVFNGFDDWFLPSMDELNLMYTNLEKAGRGGFASDYYWSSSEGNYDARGAWVQSFSSVLQINDIRYRSYRVRPVRAF